MGVMIVHHAVRDYAAWRPAYDAHEAARRAAHGRALIDREYSPRRYAQKVEAAYAHITEAAAQRRRAASVQR